MSGVARCSTCDSFVQASKLKDGTCPTCIRKAAELARKSEQAAGDQVELQRARELARADLERQERASHILLTTETAHNLPVAKRLDIITAECVIGMHLLKDLAMTVRDIFGGRSKTMQNGLREARATALSELRNEAVTLGADAVVGVSLDYNTINSDGRSMLLLVASGTAVTLQA